MICYADLAAGMVRMAEEGQEWAGKDVGLVSGAKAGFQVGILRNFFLYLVPGLLYSWVPLAWTLVHR